MTSPGESTPWHRSEKARASKKAHYESRKGYYQALERDRQLQKMYGISSAEYERMLAAQGGACKVCGADRGGPRRKTLSVDHCHATGRVRGLLCTRCNLGVGFYEKLADKIATYLRDA